MSSTYENRISSILREEGIKYGTEVTFSNLKYKKYFLRFDFSVFINNKPILIEVDGEQHFMYIKHFGTESYHKHMLENDRRKNKYCIINKIELYRIPYWEIDTINSFKDMMRPQYRVLSIWHNDNLTPQ